MLSPGSYQLNWTEHALQRYTERLRGSKAMKAAALLFDEQGMNSPLMVVHIENPEKQVEEAGECFNVKVRQRGMRMTLVVAPQGKKRLSVVTVLSARVSRLGKVEEDRPCKVPKKPVLQDTYQGDEEIFKQWFLDDENSIS